MKIRNILKSSLSIVAFFSLLSCGHIDGDGNDGKNDGSGEVIPPIIPNVTAEIMSFNIRYSNNTDEGDNNWENRKKAVLSMMRDIAPVVVGIQEARTVQKSYLKSMLPQYTLLEIPNTGTGTGGNVILMYDNQKYDKADWGWYFMSATPDVPSSSWDATTKEHRATIWGKFAEKETGKVIYVFCTHYPQMGTPADDQARVNCTELNIAKMQEIAGEDGNVFMLGDMNCSYDLSDGRRIALAKFYEWMNAARDCPDTDRYYSFNNFGSGNPSPKRNLDHIFYRNATPVSFRTIISKDYGVKYISDHYPINFTCVF